MSPHTQSGGRGAPPAEGPLSRACRSDFSPHCAISHAARPTARSLPLPARETGMRMGVRADRLRAHNVSTTHTRTKGPQLPAASPCPSKPDSAVPPRPLCSGRSRFRSSCVSPLRLLPAFVVIVAVAKALRSLDSLVYPLRCVVPVYILILCARCRSLPLSIVVASVDCGAVSALASVLLVSPAIVPCLLVLALALAAEQICGAAPGYSSSRFWRTSSARRSILLRSLR